ncbi:MAG: prolipoprotein diacylglyceryl transferase [Oculatellaceae cyanobacterium bins.114]|nr:prolipoprotein diacylglyceryl transferase [Oculatellaceae cyanobacterium bins.114]
MYPPVDPTIEINLGFRTLELHWYGLLMATAVIVGSQIASSEVERRGQKGDDFWDMLIWVLIPGFIGARLYYVFIQSPRGEGGLMSYLEHPATIFKVWEGGIHIFGGFIFGAIALYLYTRIKRLPGLVFLDAIALGLPLAQAIGRWGNFINQELYGPPTTLPWGLKIDCDRRLPPYNNGCDPRLPVDPNTEVYPLSTHFQPLFLYESLWNFVGFGLIFWISRRFKHQLKDGDLTLLYLIWYPLGRFFIEFLRTDSWFFPGTPFNVVHILSAIAILAAGIGLYVRHQDSAPQQLKE